MDCSANRLLQFSKFTIFAAAATAFHFAGCGEGFNLIWIAKITLLGQEGTGMSKKCLGTFVGSFELMFLDVWG